MGIQSQSSHPAGSAEPRDRGAGSGRLRSGSAGRRTRRARGKIRALAWLMLGTLLLGLLAMGGVLPGPRTALYGLIGLGCVAAATLPAAVLENAGRVRQLAAGFGILLVAVLFGLLPLPHLLLRVFAPGTAAAFPEHRLWTLSLVPEATVSKAAYLVLLLGMAVLAGTWGAVRWRRRTVERGIALMTLLLVVVTGTHVLGEIPHLFGLIEPELRTQRTFFAPFVNPNHFASAVLLGLPVCLGFLFRERASSPWWWIAVLAALCGSWLLIRTGSRGGTVALAVVLALTGWRTARKAGGAWTLLLVGGGLATVALGAVVARAGVGAVSLQSRMQMWMQALWAWKDTWLAGVGGGTFELAIEPYRQKNEDLAWAHLHNDPLEWLVETGLVGGMALGVAAWLLWPRRSSSPDRAFWLSLGVGAVLVHSVVEFPLQMPGIALCAVALLALRRTVFEERVAVQAGIIRAVLLGVGLAQFGAMAWVGRTAAVDEAARVVRAYAEDPQAARQAVRHLDRFAPWRGERALLRGWEALSAQDFDQAAQAARALVARHTHDGRLLRQGALILARSGAPEEAWEVLARAEVRAPDDWRTAVAKARVGSQLGQDGFSLWREAFLRGAPGQFVEEAYAVLPVGLVWLDVLTERRSGPLVRLAGLLQREGDLQTARLAYEQAAAQDPERYAHSTGYVRVLLDLEEHEAAEALLRDALSHRPGDARYAELLGTTLQARGRHAEAVEAFLLAGKTRPRAKARAIEAAGEQGLEVAERLGRQLELTGEQDDWTRLALARVHHRHDDAHTCVQLIERHGLRDQAEVQAQAQRLYRQCGGR